MILNLVALTLLTLLSHVPADAAKVRSRQAFAATAADPDARGSAALTLTSASQGGFKVKVRGLERNASFDLVVNGVRVAGLSTNRRGKAAVSFRTRPRGKALALGFDPRGAAVVVRSAGGADVLVATMPGATRGAGDLVCCIPDDSGPECEDRTGAECTAQGGTLVPGATSCLPNPCAGGAAVGNDADLICCLPDDSGPECEDRTQADCRAGGGLVVSASSCVPEPCAPIPPVAGDVICCLPDNGGDGLPECEDLSADACVTAGGAVVSATSCTPSPCGAGGGGGGGGNATVRVTCERRSDRSRISVDGNNLASGTYQARVLSGTGSATAPSASASGDEVEFDFDSEPDDIAAGATAIAPGFIQGNPPRVTGQILGGGGAVVVESTVTCTDD